jgi:hypothetical protein
MTTTAIRHGRLPSLLHTLTDQVLSPSPQRRHLAERRYRDLAHYFERHMSAKLHCRVWVYPQGSYRLGTTLVNPVTNEFDVDIVVAYDISRASITKRQLVQQMHGWLVDYYLRGHSGGDLAPSDYDGSKRRAFTLIYPDDFHMDVLPVVLEKPQPQAPTGQPSWLPDSDLRGWQPTNPRGFAHYFDTVATAQRIALAKRAEVEIDELPSIGVKTSLQRAVMLFKRHRDVMFARDPDGLAPHSSLITAMATAAYRDSRVLEPAVQDIVTGLGAQVRFRNGQLWVTNPTWKREGVELENYADRYANQPEKLRELHRWIASIQNHLGAYSAAQDLRGRAEVISTAFGEGLGKRTAEQHAKATAGVAGTMGMNASSAGLTLGAANYPRPTFHGDNE